MLATLELAFPFILGVHISAVTLTLAVVVATDLYGLLWVLGKKEVLSQKILIRSHRIVWSGLIATMSAGFLLFLPYASFLITETAFRIKMLLVALLCLNALFIGSHITIAATRSFQSLSTKEKWPLIVSGLVSTTAWIGALTAAQFLPL